MTATDELRRMLDERGVEWDYGITGATTTRFSVNGIDLTFTPMRDGLVCSTILTPAEAIAATLGAETCKLEEIDKDCDTASEYMLNREWCFDAVYRCSCGCRFGYAAHDRPRFCPNCGRRCVLGVRV